MTNSVKMMNEEMMTDRQLKILNYDEFPYKVPIIDDDNYNL